MHEQNCQNCKASFGIDDADIDFYKAMEVPWPTFCPACRFQRRLTHINTRSLYPRVLKEGTPPVISMYAQEKNLNVVQDKDWWSDTYDLFSYGKGYDFEQPFFSQFKDLWDVVPLPHLQRTYATFENSDYCNAASELKNCYLMFNADNIEDCMYGFAIEESKHCVDFSFSNKCELCYEGVNLTNCYDCAFSQDCENCNGLRWCRDCVGCTDCFGCFGLRQKSHHLFNKSLSKEEYEQEMKARNLGSWKMQAAMAIECKEFFLTQPRRCLQGRNNESVDGDYISQSKNVKESFMVKKAEHCKFAHFLSYVTDGTHYAYDYTMFGVGAEHMYESAWCGLGVNNIKFSIWNYGNADLEYCIGCQYSQNLFGCIGIRHQKYCILNKQYTKEEYEVLVPKIKEQMMNVPYVDAKGNEYRYGEFFPSELSPFAYNETWARDFCPLSKEEALHQGYNWRETTERVPMDALQYKDLPDDIADVDEATIRMPILCKDFDEHPASALEHSCTQYFKIIPQELAFYRQRNLALPRYCHNCRHAHRLNQLNPFTLYDRQCDKCAKAIQSTYAQGRVEIVYCERCYLETVY